jgi:uncharacterized protein DUF222/HNH endonuclease
MDPVPAEPAELEALPLDQLEREITELAAHINAATCHWLLLVGELDRREGWREWGCRSCAHWLSWSCGIAMRTGRAQVRVARSLRELPQIRGCFGRGEISYSQVRALVRVATPEIEEHLLMYARHGTGAQLETVCRGYRGLLAQELETTNEAHRLRYLHYSHEDDGSLVINARIPAEEGALVLTALEAAREQLRGEAQDAAEAETIDNSEGGPAGPSPARGTDEDSGYSSAGGQPSVTNADALVLMAETVLESGCERVGARGRELVVHVDADSLAHDADGACKVENGPALHPETARRLSCDAGVVRILERDGRPLSVGRRTRSVPPALARALRGRDGGCRFPGCTGRRFVDAHHIEHWARGGKTELSNLLQLCRHHHRLVHEGGYRLAKEATGIVFRRPDGQVIPRAPRPRRGARSDLIAENRRAGLAIRADTCVPVTHGDRLDLEWTIANVAEGDPRLSEGAAPP